ncbi:hypothetical protein [Tenacibaculum maritimum]|uniref:hypothetical protein n=1 Tax=Tenacibaculum maritimum TaxID=107401 RepID=UPI00388EF011
MNSEAINILLHRPIKKGVKFNHLIPFSDCNSTLLANGDTKVAIDNMAIWSKKYQHHTELLTSTIFKTNSLLKLCTELHGFLYHHFQYKIDGIDQKLRSPACSWATRAQGIDCKSYSIFASTVLLNKGISHYLRRVIQNQGEGYSHVYVVVPKNQKTNNLKDGYFTIDGTLQITQEVNFFQKDDVFVTNESTLAAGAIGASLANAGAKAITVVTDLLIQGFLNEVMGCDDAEYELPIVKLKLQRDLQEPLKKKLSNLAHAISIDNGVRIEHLFNDLFKELDLGIAHLRNETAYSQRDTCIAKILSVALKYAEELKKVVDIFYNNFKQNYSEYKISDYHTSASVNERTLYFVVKNATNPIKAEYRFIKIKKDKNEYGIEPIFGFEENHKTWLLDNISHLKTTYKDRRELAYKKEITPLIDKVIALRSKFYIGGEMLYYLEQPLQSEMNEIWLKYDDKYVQFLAQKAQRNIIANEQALAVYTNRFNKTVEGDRLAKKRKKNKLQLGIGLAIATFLIAINFEKEE